LAVRFPKMRFVVATHGHCFDGLASAVLFTRLLRHVDRTEARLEYRACGYGVGQLRADDKILSGDQNAILDYRFAPLDRLSWYFDHHRTAFQNKADRERFEQRAEGGKFFFDADYSSCTKLIADVAWRQYGLRDPKLDQLVEWADRVDAARFDGPEQAVDRQNPVMRMVAVIEHYGDDGFLSRYVPELLERPLIEVASQRELEDRYRPLGEKHERFVERVKNRAEQRGRVVFVDLTDAVLESVGKFVTYALYPRSTYSVIVGRLKSGVKISVGYNPWSGQPLDTDISAICARWGGGGHPVVGGISFKPSELPRAREIAGQIADELG
jgi:hypothetical protein